MRSEGWANVQLSSKCAIQLAFDRCELNILSNLLSQYGVSVSIVRMLVDHANCANENDSRNHLHSELTAPSKLRKEAGNRDVEFEILKTLFASFTWVSLPPKEMPDSTIRPSMRSGISRRSGTRSKHEPQNYSIVMKRCVFWSSPLRGLRNLTRCGPFEMSCLVVCVLAIRF